MDWLGQCQGRIGRPVHSFRILLGATIAKNRVVSRLPGAQPFDLLTRPTEL